MQCVRCGTVGRLDEMGAHSFRRPALALQRECRRRFTARSRSAFSRRWFTDELISLLPPDGSMSATVSELRRRCCRMARRAWRHGRSEHRLPLGTQRFLPLFAEGARSHRVPVGGKRCVDETYCAVSTADGPTVIEQSIRRAKSRTSTSAYGATLLRRRRSSNGRSPGQAKCQNVS
jgi:hypothetical protein